MTTGLFFACVVMVEAAALAIGAEAEQSCHRVARADTPQVGAVVYAVIRRCTHGSLISSR